MKKILITGASGFIAKNLIFKLKQEQKFNLLFFTRGNSEDELIELINEADFVVHLAAVNRSDSDNDFVVSNQNLTSILASQLVNIYNKKGKVIPVIFTSSIHAGSNSIYGTTKLNAEKILLEISSSYPIPIQIIRLHNVFGKWCKPNYNSFVATFCYNIIHDIPVVVNDSEAKVSLVYIDDVIERLNEMLEKWNQFGDLTSTFREIPIYDTTVGYVASVIEDFKNSRVSLVIDSVGEGFKRALYSTFLSYYDFDNFTYKLKSKEDERGIFVEMLKTKNSGQFSYFTAKPGITRGGHYHHTKNEKFLVLNGIAKFSFRNILTGEFHEKISNSNSYEVVETVPGWAHEITNIGDDILIVMLWANELFDPQKPDTFSYIIK